jgi:hypothetical protein
MTSKATPQSEPTKIPAIWAPTNWLIVTSKKDCNTEENRIPSSGCGKECSTDESKRGGEGVDEGGDPQGKE